MIKNGNFTKSGVLDLMKISTLSLRTGFWIFWNLSLPPDWHETYIDRKLHTNDYFIPLVHGKFSPEDDQDPLDFCRWKCATTHKCVAWNPPLMLPGNNSYCLLYQWATHKTYKPINTLDQEIKPSGKENEPATVFNWAYLLKKTSKGEE